MSSRAWRCFIFFLLTVNFGAPRAESTPLGLPSLKQTVVNVPYELLQLWTGRVNQLHASFTQDPCGDPLLRGQGHYQEDRRAHAEHRGDRERYLFPQWRHLRVPWCPEEGNTTPGSDPDAYATITMRLLSFKEEKIKTNMKNSNFSWWNVPCIRCVRHRCGETESMAVKEISYREKLYPCAVRLDRPLSQAHPSVLKRWIRLGLRAGHLFWLFI